LFRGRRDGESPMSMKPEIKILKSPEKVEKRLKKFDDLADASDQVVVGLPKGSNAYPDGTSVIDVGIKHEFGVPAEHIPERSYLRSTIKENVREYRTFVDKLGEKVLMGTLSSDKALQTIGVKLQTDVRQKITDIKTPALKYRVGNPLVDTGHLRQSITYQVRKK
jgi:hypothetical protein